MKSWSQLYVIIPQTDWCVSSANVRALAWVISEPCLRQHQYSSPISGSFVTAIKALQILFLAMQLSAHSSTVSVFAQLSILSASFIISAAGKSQLAAVSYVKPLEVRWFDQLTF